MFKWNIPNIITVLRILLIPLFVTAFYMQADFSKWLAALLFAIAALSDWLDGYLARRLNCVTPFGAFLDPVADKLIVVVALVMLVEEHSSVWIAVPAMIIIGREIIISALREWMSSIGLSRTVKVSIIGKIKTWMQMISIVVLMLSSEEHLLLMNSGLLILYISAALALYSMSVYMLQAWNATENRVD
ncbi:MAG: CDP-diacylglycerol--glycerol-3-phosphate 3-phosphatidyltransferase [Porticoccaceae bacterium]|nr:CDP-diacylglycerol--glycerol-3-phosphate 3-phosphatidyltransferase [Porticoccaceae bacterium]|tara:strand:- start:106 stop:669 length:564 start_codon:yes stop_codon:yes gene_type:complete